VVWKESLENIQAEEEKNAQAALNST
jgi:hypothetical protein